MRVVFLALATTSSVALVGCDTRARSLRPNQVQPSTSPSGDFVLTVPIEPRTHGSTSSGIGVWKVTLTDSSGKLCYKDEESTMIGSLNVYWGWDADDRVWLFNSDDGLIWRWEQSPAGWVKIRAERSEGCPEFVLPDYARE